MAKKKKVTQTSVVNPVMDVLRDVPNPQSFPWPQKNASFDEMICNDVFEFVPGDKRGDFMDEVYRVLTPGGKATFNLRYWNTDGAIQDYLVAWPPLCEKSFLYFNKDWRVANNLKRPIKCDFDFSYGYMAEPNTANRSDEVRSFNIKYYTNVINVLQIVLTKK